MFKNTLVTGGTKKIPQNNTLVSKPVFKIPLSELKYNFYNGRIGTTTSKLLEEHDINNISVEELNNIIESAIIDSDKHINQTKNNIKVWGQKEPGVVLEDGTVIDGNRRFTCIRNLHKEFPDNPNFNYFEAVILNEEESTERNLKAIEWALQMGTEERVDYDPIEKILDLYHQVVELKNYTIEEYSQLTNTKKSDAEGLLLRAKLIKDFLIYINQPDKWYLAKQFKLDGPIAEIAHLKRIQNEDERKIINEVIFDYLIAWPEKDMGKYLRNNVINLIPSKSNHNIEQWVNNHVSLHNKIFDSFEQNGYNLETINKIRNDEKLTNDLLKNASDFNLRQNCLNVIEEPIKTLEKVNKMIESGIKLDIIKRLDTLKKEKIKSKIEEIKTQLDEVVNEIK